MTAYIPHKLNRLFKEHKIRVSSFTPMGCHWKFETNIGQIVVSVSHLNDKILRSVDREIQRRKQI